MILVTMAPATAFASVDVTEAGWGVHCGNPSAFHAADAGWRVVSCGRLMSGVTYLIAPAIQVLNCFEVFFQEGSH
jgi:hypothetical protein